MSTSLFIAIMVFMFVLLLQVIILGNDTFSYNLEKKIYEPITFSDFQKPSPDADFNTTIKSVCCIVVAFGYS